MIRNFLHDEGGQGMVEYGLIIGLIAIIVIAVFVALGPQIKNLFANAVDSNSLSKSQAAMSEIMHQD